MIEFNFKEKRQYKILNK